MLEKTTKKGGTTRSCVREECGHKEDVPETAAQPPASGAERNADRVAG